VIAAAAGALVVLLIGVILYAVASVFRSLGGEEATVAEFLRSDPGQELIDLLLTVLISVPIAGLLLGACGGLLGTLIGQVLLRFGHDKP